MVVGGVRRPLADVEPSKQPEPKPSPILDYGVISPVPADRNPQVASVAQALQEKKHPERLSVLIQPRSFERAAFEKDPQTYLNTIEPGRVFQPAQPGAGVPRLSSHSPRLQRVVQGESVYLEVGGVSGMPVTFTSFDLGAFDNDLNSITVRADERGRARVKFTATPGTINDIHILAASPVTSGQMRYLVNVRLPEATGGR